MSKAKNYTFQEKNATAVNILRSWLTACGIPSRRSQVPGFDLTVDGKSGDVEVQVSERRDETLPGAGIQVVVADFTGKKVAVALAAFHKVTRAAGYGKPQPFDRGAAPMMNAEGNPRKLHYKDEEFLVSIRHNEFRRAPNPGPDRWEKYKATMNKVAQAFMRTNFELCARNGMTLDDVMTYARCYVVNFCARHEIPETETTFCDNERKCHSYLQQRLYLGPSSSLRAILLKKERSMLPDAETVSIGLFGKPDADTEVSPDADAEEVDYDYVAKHCQLDVSSPAKRKKSAATKLTELLGKLPHDQMVELLGNAAKNINFDFTTRKEAARQLRLHAEACESCALPDDAGVKEDEDAAGSDALSTEE
jgi:hypothetical protein